MEELFYDEDLNKYLDENVENTIVRSNLNRLLDSVKCNGPFYRGFDDEFVKKIYGVDITTKSGINQFADQIFFVGCKSNAFYSSDNRYSDNEFWKELIQSYLEVLKGSNNFLGKGFCKANRDCIDYLQSDVFYVDIDKLKDEKIYCNLVLYYYLSVLHRVRDVVGFADSFTISSTIDLDVARNYASGKDGNAKEQIVLFAFQPHNDMGLYYECEIQDINDVFETNFPIFNFDILHNQKEIPYQFGLFPHQIIGFYYNKGKNFYFNKYLPDNHNDERNFADDGIYIHQENFLEDIKKFKLLKYYFFLNPKTGRREIRKVDEGYGI